ncbi:MAG TPA: 3-phosphoshikimate 1-carboxyvinyltransferase, partial [Cyclobacteriaceae bacterium]|nr:3-phosphoshikimate 1-carboxyvinyltransferase [Cyclobacteriaceae bacterium]
NLSAARDTQLMQSLLTTANHVIDVMDAGTTMRFLTAYFAVTRQNKLLTGTDRMKERPINLLVDALRTLGVTIDYKGKEGFPPIETGGFDRQLTNLISIRGDISSQFISALMMVAPALPLGLTIELQGKTGSFPYLRMTAELMSLFGVRPELSEKQIQIGPGSYKPATYRVEPDWSAASYWFAFTALAQSAAILLPKVEAEALQGDKVIIDIMSHLGVKSEFTLDGLRLTKSKTVTDLLKWDFTNCPDLAQTVLPVCAAKNIKGVFIGLESLRIKETDRIAALQAELGKINARLVGEGGAWNLLPAFTPPPPGTVFKTYHDHRMAMGLAPLATLADISIDSPDVVNKSYPSFWEDLGAIGFRTELK